MWAIIKSIFLALPGIVSLVTKITEMLEKRAQAKIDSRTQIKKEVVSEFVTEIKACKTDQDRIEAMKRYVKENADNDIPVN